MSHKQTIMRVIAFTLALTLALSVAATALAGYKTIPYGEQSDGVRKLQKELKSQGCYSGSIDGKFGPATKKAVIKYQKSIGLKADGKPGNKTLTALYEGGSTAVNTSRNSELNHATKPKNPRTLYYGCTGERVSALQRALRDVGCYSGAIDGKYGDLTYDAVKRYQYKMNLRADGMAGTKTLASLNKKAKTKVSGPFVLDVGSKGDEVTKIQIFLRNEGYDLGSEKGTYGELTAQAVRDWQSYEGKKITGTITESQYNDLMVK